LEHVEVNLVSNTHSTHFIIFFGKFLVQLFFFSFWSSFIWSSFVPVECEWRPMTLNGHSHPLLPKPPLPWKSNLTLPSSYSSLATLEELSLPLLKAFPPHLISTLPYLFIFSYAFKVGWYISSTLFAFSKATHIGVEI